MTPTEMETRLNELSDDEYEEITKRVGGDRRTREKQVSGFVYSKDQEHMERIWCRHLGLKTEQEKLTEAAMQTALAATDSAVAAKDSADTAKEALAQMKTQAISAWIAAAVAVLALASQIVALIVG